MNSDCFFYCFVARQPSCGQVCINRCITWLKFCFFGKHLVTWVTLGGVLKEMIFFLLAMIPPTEGGQSGIPPAEDQSGKTCGHTPVSTQL